MDIEIYTKSNCPECVKVKQFFKSEGYQYDEFELTPDNISDFMKYTRSAPVVFVDNEFYTNEQILNGSFIKPDFDEIHLDF